jgi:hypothetical protein
MTAVADENEQPYETAEEIFADLAREGGIVDSGTRRWSERKQRWEIVWVAREIFAAAKEERTRAPWALTAKSNGRHTPSIHPDKEKAMWDLNNADDNFDPMGVYRVKSKLRPGGFGDERLLRLAKSMRTQGLDLELTVVGGAYNGRKVFDLITVVAELGDKPELAPITEDQAAKYQTAVNIGLSKLRRMLESARGIAHDDEGQEAKKARCFESLRVFDGIEYWAQIGIEEGGNGYRARNVVERAVTPDMDEWPGPLPKPPPLSEQMDDEIPY